MDDELRTTIARPFKVRGKSRLTRAEFSFAMSLDLKWFGPDECREVIEAGLRAGLLKEEKGRLTPAFDYKAVNVPTGFRPGPGIFKKRLMERIEILLVNDGVEASAVHGMIERKRQELCDLVTPEVAGLVIAKERGLEVTALIDEALLGFMRIPH
ncbi:MAG TPA: DUF2240 family protein [Methanocella sp.]|nr:DUF2240 family protein [Methanocella sp.]